MALGAMTTARGHHGHLQRYHGEHEQHVQGSPLPGKRVGRMGICSWN